MRAGFEPYPKFKCACGLTGGLTARELYHWHGSNELNTFFAQPLVLCAMCPSAEAVRGWRALNRPTVCTNARLRTRLSFYA
jgi:hypothetical protein